MTREEKLEYLALLEEKARRLEEYRYKDFGAKLTHSKRISLGD